MITRGVYSATCSILNDDYSLNVDATIAHAASTAFPPFESISAPISDER